MCITPRVVSGLLQVRDMVHDFYNSRYATCFAALESLKPLLAMDIHLHDHVKALMAEIKTRALVQVRKQLG
jgi:COP9 signalosome complex subunit 1